MAPRPLLGGTVLPSATTSNRDRRRIKAARFDWPASPSRVVQRGSDTYLEYDLDHDGRVDYLQRLRDGYKDQLCFPEVPGAPPRQVVTRPATELTDRRLLLLLLDGVAYERMRGLYDGGGFRLFRPPAKLISVFPTLTDPAYDVLFGTGPTPGYEAGYFDRAANRLTGAFGTYLRGGNEAWVRYVDYRLSFVKDAIMYLFPKWVYGGELKRARRVLDEQVAAGRREVVLYILSTDGLGHMLSPEQIDRQLSRLDGWIERLVYDQRGELEIVMLADHGLGRLPPGCTQIRRFDLRGVLRAAGLRIVRRLKRPGDVALPLFGLLDVARLHTGDDATRDRVVAACRACEEIEVIAARGDDCLHVYTLDASAAIHRRTGGGGQDLYSYEPAAGDPLRLAGACGALRAAKRMDADGFASARAWQEATCELAFPAAPQRLWEGVFSISREQPDVVVSLNDRCFVGSGLLSRFVKMQGTHGGLHRRSSETFVMTTSLDLESPLDLRDVGRMLRREFGWAPVARCRSKFKNGSLLWDGKLPGEPRLGRGLALP